MSIPIFFKATDRLKSDKEIAKEEQERLNKLEVSYHIEIFWSLIVSIDLLKRMPQIFIQS